MAKAEFEHSNSLVDLKYLIGKRKEAPLILERKKRREDRKKEISFLESSREGKDEMREPPDSRENREEIRETPDLRHCHYPLKPPRD